MVTKAMILERVRKLQDERGTTLTDDEVKGILCSTMNMCLPVDHWEEQVILLAIRAIRERATTSPLPKEEP